MAESMDWAQGIKHNKRWVKFVMNYVTNGYNATKAYIDAGYSKKGAAQAASRLLTNVKVQKALAKLLETQVMSKEELKARVSQDARASMAPFIVVNEQGEMTIDWSKAEEAGALQYIKEVTVKDGIVTSIKLVDSQKAKEQLIKMFGMAVDVLEISGRDKKPVEVINKTVFDPSTLSTKTLKELVDKAYGRRTEDD